MATTVNSLQPQQGLAQESAKVIPLAPDSLVTVMQSPPLIVMLPISSDPTPFIVLMHESKVISLHWQSEDKPPPSIALNVTLLF